MRTILLRKLAVIMAAAILMCSCSENAKEPPYTPLRVQSGTTSPADSLAKPQPETEPIRIRHAGAPLKILAIGNSFTNCATHYLPRLIKYLNADSICVAKLVRNSASLSMHWSSHSNNSPDYEMYYSDDGAFVLTDINTIDRALTVMDWDIIVLQQASGIAGDYSTYYPALEYLMQLFRESNPNMKSGWQYTWAYMPGTQHADFYRYDHDPDKMHEASVAVSDRICEENHIDIRIPSALLVRDLRNGFPEVTDGFSYDGVHIDMMGLGGFALSALWYECLVKPTGGVSSLERRLYFDSVGMGKSDVDKALDMVGALTHGDAPDDGSSVGMVFE